MLEHDALLFHAAFDRPAPTSSLLPTFRFGGTATSKGGSVSLRSDGLHVAVGPHRSGTWQGYYVATSATFPADAVIHVRMGRRPGVVPLASQSGIALLAVQTGASALLDYALVSNVASNGQNDWFVGHATGTTTYATTKMLAHIPTAAAAEDITLRTDGRSRYAVYFGDQLVYSSTTLHLGVAPPLRVYLEVEALGMAYQTRFQDFWVTAGSSVRVAGLRRGELVALTPAGHGPVTAVADSTGQARLELPPSESVGRGTFTIDGPHGRHRFAGVAFAGGDRFAFTP